MENLTIKGLLFDYGGTLDTNGRHWAWVLWDGYVNAGVPITKEVFKQVYVFGERTLATEPLIKADDTFRTVLMTKVGLQLGHLLQQGTIAVDEAQCTVWNRQIVDFCYNRVLENMASAKRVLEWCAARYPLVLVSNFYGNIETVLREFGIDGFFCSVAESAVVGVRKPSPRLFSIALQRLALQPCETCVIGDSYRKDMMPAREAGCHTVWLKGEGWEDERVDETLPDAVVTSLSQLVRILNKE